MVLRDSWLPPFHLPAALCSTGRYPASIRGPGLSGAGFPTVCLHSYGGSDSCREPFPASCPGRSPVLRTHPLPDLLPPTTPETTHAPPWPGTCATLPEQSGRPTSPIARRLVRIRRRIVFTCVAVVRVPTTLLSTPPRGDAVALRLSVSFMVSIVPGLPPGGVVRLDGARACRVAAAAVGAIVAGVWVCLAEGRIELSGRA